MSKFEEELIASRLGRVGADRMALGLGCIPDPERGDMEVVVVLRARVAELEAENAVLKSKIPDPEIVIERVCHGAQAIFAPVIFNGKPI